MRYKLLSLFIAFSIFAFGQHQVNLDIPQANWMDISSSDIASSVDFFQLVRSEAKEPANLSWKSVQSTSDQLGWEHVKYQQYYLNVPVLGHVYILHSKDGQITKANGMLNKDLQLPTQPFLTEREALLAATKHLGSKEYVWQRNQSFFGKNLNLPNPELVIMDQVYPQFSGNYVLAYRMDIYSSDPHRRDEVFVNAWNGEVINSIPKMYSCGGDQGTAETIYHGEREIQTTFSNGQYILLDETRGGGLHTVVIDSSDFVDDDNYWEAGTNPQKNGALDGHFGIAATYDWLLDRFNRRSVDGNDAPITAFIYTNQGVNNAFWNGESVIFGDGDSTTYGPFTAIDVCSHEVTHGVTQHTAGLVYQYESGALNESFSDIFGKAVEMAYDSAEFSWELGHKMKRGAGAGFRNMEDPHLYQNPSYYKGEFWVAAPFDNGGVHFNSGVMNHWFYLLCEGKAGVNEGGLDYDVPAIGMEKAVQIAYRALSAYMWETSQYADARQATLEACKDLFGPVCSDEYSAVTEAWMAVGVGHRAQDNDLSIISFATNSIVCQDQELQVSLKLFNNGCRTEFDEGTTFNMSYSIDGGVPVEEAFVLPFNVDPGKAFDYTFNTLSPLGTQGPHVVTAKAEWAGDMDTSNNVTVFTVTQTSRTEHDVALNNASFGNNPCAAGDSMQATLIFSHSGCSIIPEGESVEISFEGEGYSYQTTYTLDRDLYPDSRGFLRLMAPTPPFGPIDIDIIISYAPDPNPSNDMAIQQLALIKANGVGYHEGFDGLMSDSSSLVVGPAEPLRPYRAFYGLQEAFGEEALVVTGGEPIIVRPNKNWDFFRQLNLDRQLNINLCYDSDGWTQPRLLFDMIQVKSSYEYDTARMDPDFANTFILTFDTSEVMIRDIQESDPEPITYSFALPIDVGTVFIEMNALAMNGALDTNGDILLDDDRDLIIIDNIKIVETVSTSDEVADKVSLYPNPAYSSIRLTLDRNSDLSIASVRAISASGKEVPLAGIRGIYDISGLAKGTYWIVTTLTDGRQEWKSLIKM